MASNPIGRIKADTFHRHLLIANIERQEVTVNEEYKVYDFNGILGSVGGSLGLFIGFSFLQMMLYFTGKLWNMRKPCAQKRREENQLM